MFSKKKKSPWAFLTKVSKFTLALLPSSKYRNKNPNRLKQLWAGNNLLQVKDWAEYLAHGGTELVVTAVTRTIALLSLLQSYLAGSKEQPIPAFEFKGQIFYSLAPISLSASTIPQLELKKLREVKMLPFQIIKTILPKRDTFK